jgi:hypothetical protein
MLAMSAFYTLPYIRKPQLLWVRDWFSAMSGDVQPNGDLEPPLKTAETLMSGCPEIPAPKGGISPWRTSRLRKKYEGKISNDKFPRQSK